MKKKIVASLLMSFIIAFVSFSFNVHSYNEKSNDGFFGVPQEEMGFLDERLQLLNEITSRLLRTTGLNSYDEEFLTLLAHEVEKLNNMYFNGNTRFNVVSYDDVRFQKGATIACCADMKVATIVVEVITDWFNPHPHPGKWIRESKLESMRVCQNCGSVH